MSERMKRKRAALKLYPDGIPATPIDTSAIVPHSCDALKAEISELRSLLKAFVHDIEDTFPGIKDNTAGAGLGVTYHAAVAALNSQVQK